MLDDGKLKRKNMENKHPQLNVHYQTFPIHFKIWYGDMFGIQWICSSRVSKLRLSLIQLQTCTFQNYFIVTEDLDPFGQVSLIMIGAKLCRTVAVESWI